MDASQRTTLFIAITWPLLVAAGTAWWIDQRLEGAIASATSHLTPVAVVDTVAYMQAGQEGATPELRARGGLQAAHTIKEKLRERGYVVLDRNVIMAAPDTVMVRP